MRKIRGLILLVLVFCLCVGVEYTADAKTKKKVKLNKTKLTLTESKTYKLKLKNNKKKVKWSSTKKSIVSVSSKGKIKAKKAGKATIVAKASGKKYKCKVTVKAKKKVITDNDKGFTKTVQPDYQANYARLKENIQLYGVTNDSGNKVLNGTTSYNTMEVGYGIVYDATNQRFDFVLITDVILEDDSGALGGLILSVTEADIAKGSATYGIAYELGYYGSASGTYSLADIHSTDNSLAWDEVDSDLSNIYELANLSVDLGYLYWEKLLADHNVGLSMTDLGFGA